MYQVRMAFVLIQVGTNLWVNPMQVQGIETPQNYLGHQCVSYVIAADGVHCSDWTIKQIKEALTPAAVSHALEGK